MCEVERFIAFFCKPRKHFARLGCGKKLAKAGSAERWARGGGAAEGGSGMQVCQGGSGVGVKGGGGGGMSDGKLLGRVCFACSHFAYSLMSPPPHVAS